VAVPEDLLEQLIPRLAADLSREVTSLGAATEDGARARELLGRGLRRADGLAGQPADVEMPASAADVVLEAVARAIRNPTGARSFSDPAYGGTVSFPDGWTGVLRFTRQEEADIRQAYSTAKATGLITPVRVQSERAGDPGTLLFGSQILNLPESP
jgi:hypothetical protein